MKKINGDQAPCHYREMCKPDLETGEIIELLPEYTTMSRGGAVKGSKGIGGNFFNQFKSDLYPSDQCIIEGRPMKPPKY